MTDRAVRVGRVAAAVIGDFFGAGLELSDRRDLLKEAGTWQGMPEVAAVSRLREVGAGDREVRLFITFTAAMDRMRDAEALWMRSAGLFVSRPEVFQPERIVRNPREKLRAILSHGGVSQRHGPDSDAWWNIAQSLCGSASPVVDTVDTGIGNVAELLRDLPTKDRGRTRFPMLRGPKIGPMWVRMLAAPGGAGITGLERLPVQVDVQVRRATRHLGVADPPGADVDEPIRSAIQAAWREGVDAVRVGGPTGMQDTCAALDPALWSLAKYGCTHCERVGSQMPVSRACDGCQFQP